MTTAQIEPETKQDAEATRNMVVYGGRDGDRPVNTSAMKSMKTPDSRSMNTKDEGQRVAAAAPSIPDPKDSSKKSAAGPAPVVPSAELEAELREIAEQEESLKQRKALRRQQYWQLTVASMLRAVEQLLSYGFERAAIGKALGFPINGKPGAPAPGSKKGTGPTTHDGWYTVYLNAGIRSYLASHGALSTKLKTSQVPPAEYVSHLPAEDRAAIERVAREKAQAKCPPPASSEVPD